MGIFRQFPYSNFHEMNMDEIIKIVKNMLEEWAQYYNTWENWKDQVTQEWAEMRSFINNYFDNLDVQEEINNKITSMVETGEFSQIVDPYVPPAVADWLAEHITQPVGVVIDNSLTVRGACADAKATGDALKYKINQPLDIYHQITYGVDGQLLRTKGDGSTEWVDYGLPTDEQTTTAINAWLDAHPEATTTVQDGSLTEAKFSNLLQLKTIKEYVTPEMFGAIGDGVADDTASINSALATGKIVLCTKNYVITELDIDQNGTILVGGNFKLADNTAVDNTVEYYPVYITADDVILKDCVFDGNASNNTSFKVCDIITCFDNSNCLLDNVAVFNAPDSGFMISESVGTVVKNCLVDTSTDAGFYINNNNSNNLNNNIFVNCKLYNCGSSGIAIKRGCKNIIIDSCILENCLNGITAETIDNNGGLNGGIVSNCRIIGNNGSIGIGWSNSDFECCNCYVEGYEVGTRILQNSNARIYGCHIKMVSQTGSCYGIRVSENGNAIVDNCVVDGVIDSGAGVYVGSSSELKADAIVSIPSTVFGFRITDATAMSVVLNGCTGTVYTGRQTIMNHNGAISQTTLFKIMTLNGRSVWQSNDNVPPDDFSYFQNGDYVLLTATGLTQNLAGIIMRINLGWYKVPIELMS